MSPPETIPLHCHGTRADLQPDDLIRPGFRSNFGRRAEARFVDLTGTLEAAVWGAELALGDAPPRIYLVVPTGPIEDDPNLTNAKFPGNPTLSYRSEAPLRVVAEITRWTGHSPDVLQAMRDRLDEKKRQGIEAINE